MRQWKKSKKHADTQYVHGIVIDKGVECPPVNMTSPWTFLAFKMAPGDSVEVKSRDHLDKLKDAISRLGFHPIRRKLGEEHYRIWKMAKGYKAKRQVGDWVKYADRTTTFIASGAGKVKRKEKK